MTLGLANMRELMASLGNPERRFEAVVVAGTNGKGSVSAFTAAILGANGKRVGLYTSPHVYSVRERICVAGRPVSLEAMEEAAARIVPLFDSIRYSYFEALTAIAFQVFADSGVEWAVLEVGLGGRFDATNIVEPRVSVLTGVSLDHRRILGDTEEEILREKLGIARPHVPLVCGELPPRLRTIVEERARNDRIPLHVSDSLGTAELRRMSFENMQVRLRTAVRDYGDVLIPFVGSHQVRNALVATRTAELVLGRVDRLGEALQGARLPGRFEAVDVGGKTVVLDVAHNDGALSATLETLTSLSPAEENGIILGVMRRKELRSFPGKLAAHVRRVYLVGLSDKDAYTAPELLGAVGVKTLRGTGLDVSLAQAPLEEGLARLIGKVLSPEETSRVIVITGSHRTVEVFGRHLHTAGYY
jgi:dihydrofolate synthase/folylpolyglutamate synthase